jgi:cytochrome P450 family 4
VLGDEPITIRGLSELKYLECCIKEALRLFPSVPMLGRALREDTQIGEQIVF